MAAHRHLGHHPVASAGLLDAQIDHDDVDAGQLLQVGIVDPDPGLDHLAEHQHLAGALGEPAQRNVAGGQRHRAGIDGGHPQNRHENPSAGEQFDDQAEHARLLAARC